MPVSASQAFEKPAQPDAWLYVDEITHRTINDYAAMLSMLRRASRHTTDAASVDALDAVARRMEASAAAYHILRPTRGSCLHRLDDDLERLCASLTSSVLTDRSIKLDLVSERLCVGARRSWQISLIVAELVMNVTKHAFSSAPGAPAIGGAILIDVRLTGAQIQCAVADNGAAKPASPRGRGSCIVDALVADLGGTIIRHLGPTGSSVVLCVPAAEPIAAPHTPDDTIVQ